MEQKTEGIVLKSIDLKENDKLLTILTPSGKLTASIRGVRKPKAKLNFASQPFCFAEYILASRGDYYTVTGAYSYDGFYELRTDIVKFYTACTLTEIADALTVEDDAKTVFVSLIEALKNLSLTDMPVQEILLTYALTVLRESGYPIDLTGCSVCGGEVGDKPYFDLSTGAFTCGSCCVGVRASRETYDALQKAVGLTEQPSTEHGEKRAMKLILAYLTEKTEREFSAFQELMKLL